jgi:hypothetical protein
MEDFNYEPMHRRSFGELTGIRDEVHIEEDVVYRGLESLELVESASFWPRDELFGEGKFPFGALGSEIQKPTCMGAPLGIKTFDKSPVSVPPLEVVVGPFAPSCFPLEQAVYVEPNSSFVSSRPPFEILNAVCAWLESDLIDFEVNSDECVIQGVARSGASSCSFCFRAYRNSGPGVVFELQRRQGCVVFFYSLFSRLVNAIGLPKTELDWPSTEMAIPDDLGDIPPPLSFSSPCSLSLDITDASSLLDMLDSSHYDVQLEALRVLAAAAESNSLNTEVLCEAFSQAGNSIQQLVRRLSEILQQSDEMARCAAVILSAVAQQQPTSVVACRALLPALASVMSAPSTLSSKDTKRQLSSALAALASQLSPQEVRNLLQPALFSQDSRLRTSAQQTVNMLAVSC